MKLQSNTNKNIKKKTYELQLKGSGRTPFSRHADGNSVLSSAMRQFLASQLLYGLNIPTTRALSLVVCNEQVVRDPFYNGNIKIQNSAVVLRISQSFLRFGSVQVCLQQANMRKQKQIENRKILTSLFDFLIEYYYKNQIDEDKGDPYEQVYYIIVQRTAQLVAYWQSIGFVHGVLNTDNMSLINVTIDYGPFAFIDYFSKDYVSNATDQYQRYSYRRQPQTIKWNLIKLAQAMNSIVPSKILIKYVQQHFNSYYQNKYYAIMMKKIGLSSQTSFINGNNHKNKQKKQIIDELFETMDICSSHFTNVFRILQQSFRQQSKQLDENQIVQRILNQSCNTVDYLKNLRVYPNLINRPYDEILKYDTGFNIQFIRQQQKRYTLLSQLKSQGCKQRYERQKQLWTKWINKYMKQSPQIQSNSSPKYLLLNQIATKITKEVLQFKNDQQKIQFIERVLSVFHHPYQYNQWFENHFWKDKPKPIKLTCSS